jgi:hypothetical protein
MLWRSGAEVGMCHFILCSILSQCKLFLFFFSGVGIAFYLDFDSGSL